MAKAKLLEPFEDLGRRGGMWGATAIPLRICEGGIETPEVPGSLLPKLVKGKAAVVPGLESSRVPELEDQASAALLVAETVGLEVRDVAELEHNVPVAELEHETALAEVTEVSRLEVGDMSELEGETTVAEVPEVP